MIYKALLVEDNKDTSSALMEMLQHPLDSSIAFDIHPVYSARECTEELIRVNNSYDVILLDLNLPDVKGEFTFLRVYDAANLDIGLPTENRTPIVVITGGDTNSYSLIRRGAMDVLHKPVTADQLFKTLWMAILHFPYKRSRELQNDIKQIVKDCLAGLTEAGQQP